jgi:hypothetical protein
LKSEWRTGHSDFGQTSAERVLTRDECCATCGTALLAVVVGEGAAFLGNAIDIRGLIAHHAAAKVTEIPRANVIAPKDQNIRLFFSHNFFPSLIYFCVVVAGQRPGKSLLQTKCAHRGITRTFPACRPAMPGAKLLQASEELVHLSALASRALVH